MTYRSYRDRHRRPQTVAHHALVTVAAWTATFICLGLGRPFLPLLILVAAIALNGLSHAVWEGNRPAFRGRPGTGFLAHVSDAVWSVIWDHRLTFDWLTGRYRGQRF